MAEAKEHLERLRELSEKIAGLVRSIKQAEKDLKFQWVDEIEQRDLQSVKDHMTAVEDALRVLRKEMSHIEAEHCKEGKRKL
jgi:Sec-independent protein translocase protein TatA